MQPPSRLKLDNSTGPRLLLSIRHAIEARRLRTTSPAELPEVLGIKLTNRCNLRCTHCYQWNESGHHRDMGWAEQNLDLDVSVIERVLDETRAVQSRLYLWGGEPFVHREIERILALLAQHRRVSTICTNAYYISAHINRLCDISEFTELLIAVEGFEAEHDSLRGKGSFRKVMATIDELLGLRAAGRYNGKIFIHTVIHDQMIGKLYDLLKYIEELKIDMILLCFPWYISDYTSRAMDDFVHDRFDWLIDVGTGRHSWDAYKYRIEPASIERLLEDLGRINTRTWTTKVRYQPGLEFDEIEAFVRGMPMSARCATTCRVLDRRTDITPTGDVVACKFFPEFAIGNLRDNTLSALWQSDRYHRIRETLGQQLSPACSKCSALYLHADSPPQHI